MAIDIIKHNQWWNQLFFTDLGITAEILITAILPNAAEFRYKAYPILEFAAEIEKLQWRIKIIA